MRTGCAGRSAVSIATAMSGKGTGGLSRNSSGNIFRVDLGIMSKNRPVPNTPKRGATRRELFQIGNSLMLPALMGGSAAMAATGPLRPGKDIYRSIGVEPVINCRGTFTIIGASVELPEVRAAMDSAAQQFVQLDELAEAVGRRLSE